MSFFLTLLLDWKAKFICYSFEVFFLFSSSLTLTIIQILLLRHIFHFFSNIMPLIFFPPTSLFLCGSFPRKSPSPAPTPVPSPAPCPSPVHSSSPSSPPPLFSLQRQHPHLHGLCSRDWFGDSLRSSSHECVVLFPPGALPSPAYLWFRTSSEYL